MFDFQAPRSLPTHRYIAGVNPGMPPVRLLTLLDEYGYHLYPNIKGKRLCPSEFDALTKKLVDSKWFQDLVAVRPEVAVAHKMKDNSCTR